MNRRIQLVVGDKFAQFAEGKDVLTLSQLHALLDSSNSVIPNHDRMVLLPGQGLGDQDIEHLLTAARQSTYRRYFDFSQWYNLPKRAASTMSHKHLPENTLISEPRPVSQDVFQMHLMIDEKCELMADHQSGEHVQGMVLVEAARQSLLVVTEAFFLPHSECAYSFVFEDMSVQYNHFAFPLPALLRYEIIEKDTSKPKRQHFVSEIAIIQSGIETVSFRMSFSAIEASRISHRENKLANQAIKEYIAGTAEHLSPGENGDIAVNM